jgi:hypothetical protein
MDFVDEARRVRDWQMLAEEPARLATRYAGGEVQDAYLAAVAVALARELQHPPPRWATDPSRALRKPHREPAADDVAGSLFVQIAAELDQVLERRLARF